MARVRLLSLAFVVALLAAAFPTAPAFAKKKHPPALKVTYVEAQGVVQPGSTDGFSVDCPKATPHAIGSYFGSTDTQSEAPLLAVSASFPFGAKNKSWSTGVRDLSPDPQAYYVGTVCASGGPYRYISDAGSVDANGANGFDETCPKAMPKALAGFFAPQSTDTGQLSLAASDPSGTHAWTISVKNNTDQPQGFIAGAVCVPAKTKVDFLGSDTRQVQPGTTDYANGTCPKKFPHPVGGWFGIPSGEGFGNLAVVGSSFVGNRKNPHVWEVGVANLLTDPHSWFAGITCMGG